ncbi:kinesin-like protein KIN-4C isoform X1 [Lathyrus oleraceus]|uniref:kinesin-like protein KIN-4C isoform X1 n=1 Tax=Pisum sativum TaxID=3888 RepID=UPI0021D3A67B|nr:kinesin-like protein KIN-4C isoform X1 [Pisum sativum]
MEHTETNAKNPDSAQCVRVAVNIRPLITAELLHGCTNCITVPPGEPQVQIGTHAFTYDFVYGSTGSPSAAIYDDCVAPLVDALFHGYNATVLAYGQTGSGKTYTMGTNYSGEDSAGGIIPQVMRTIFNRVQDFKDESSEFLIRVSFIEIFKEEVYDLLDPNASKGELAGNAKFAGPARVPIQIRETYSGGITLAGVTEPEVKTKEEMSSYLSRGSMSRATGSTNMNSQSSRSHAIFTITMEQKNGDDVLCAKLHLVDLAGSERAKRTGADGMRLKEGIHINKGLLTLGNVISALGDERKRKEGGHVPYRDSKLTRLLQDSLGGNSKTVMIACVSPADTNVEETLNTLKYANRARNIQNKAIINRDPMGAQQQRLQSRIDQLEAELLCFKGLGGGPMEEIQILKHKVSLLEASNAELQRELHGRGQICESLKQRACDAQLEKDQLMMKIEAARNGKSWDEIDSSSNQDCDLMKSYVSKIHDLEEELLRLKSLNVKSSNFADWVDSDDLEFQPKNGLFAGGNEYSSDCDVKPVGITDDVEQVDVREKELEHSSAQEKLDRELKELDKKLEQKEAEMKLVNNASVLRQHYEKKLLELEHEKKYLQREIEELKSTSGDSTHKLKEEYLQKLNALESQVSELKKKQDAQAHLLRQKQKGDEAAKKLQDEIQRIKSQKVQLQHKIKQESEQFRLWKASREKEVLQLKKEGRKNEYERHKLLALNQRTKMVLQRKTEEASLATKRLKELLESRKASSRETGISGPGIQALMKAIEHELEVTVRVHEVRSEYQRQMEVRAEMAAESARLKEEAEKMKLNNTSSDVSMSPAARSSRIFALDNMLATSSTTLVSMASQLSEAEERERVFSGKGRWNQVRSLADAKNLMNYLFNLASSSRCSLREIEFICRDKDMEISYLKEKIVSLRGSIEQLKMQRDGLDHQLNLMRSESMRNSGYYVGGHPYDLRKLENRRSTILFEDMEISDPESDEYDVVDATDDEWVESAKLNGRKRKSKTGELSSLEKNHSITSSDDVKDISTEAPDAPPVKTASDVCCSCSKSSSCKTSKCMCRATGIGCGSSCSCRESKCANRGGSSSNELQQVTENDSGSDEANKNRLLATQGAELLQGALIEGPAETKTDNVPRKALSDIGNSLPKSNATTGNQRKKWRRNSSVVLVTEPPPSSSQSGDSDVSKKEKANISEANVYVDIPQKMHPPKFDNASMPPKPEVNDTKIPLRIPRAMQKQGSFSTILPLGDRNASKQDESIKKEPEVDATNPIRQKRTLAKENNEL